MKFATCQLGGASLVAKRQTGGDAASKDATNTARLARSMHRMSDVRARDTLASGDHTHGDEA